MFCKEGVLKNFAKFTRKRLCQSLFFNKVAGLSFATLLKKRLWSSRKPRILPQASSEQADAQSRPQVSRQMLPIHFHSWTCLSIVMLESTSCAKRFPPKTLNEKKFLSTQSLTFILTENQWTLLKLANSANTKCHPSKLIFFPARSQQMHQSKVRIAL